MTLAHWLNTGWMLSCRREARHFHHATHSVSETQQALLLRILAANQSTEFGRRHAFGRIRSSSEYQQRVPRSNYEAYADAIQRIAAGQDNVLTREPVELLEPTSGSSNRGEKLIPYTSSLRREFQRAVAVWVADVMRHRPAMRRGRAYWSVSPAMESGRVSPGGIPIGFDDDAAYLGRLERCFLKYLLIVPPSVTRLKAMDNFRYCTLLYLLGAADLSLISIWSPTFLTSLISSLDEWGDRICRDLRNGRLSLPVPGDSEIQKLLTSRLRRDGHRSEQLHSILQTSASKADKLQQMWPQLDLISCWADAMAGEYLGGLRELFPNVAIQPKGLLATEGCVSFPLVDRHGAVLAIRSHFFEFAKIDHPQGGSANPATPRLADQLDMGQRYKVLLTTGGGLYRVELNDIVEVVGYENQCPLLRFVGRADRVSDLVGEKLNELHLQDVLHRVLVASGIVPQFSLVVPTSGPQPCYRLYLQADDIEQLRAVSSLIARDVDAGLRENPYYQHAVEFSQLAPLEVRLLDGDRGQAWRVYERVCLERGQKAGDIKPTVLDTWPGWPVEFDRAFQNDCEHCSS